MNKPNSIIRRHNPSTTFMVVGLLLTFAVLMFRPSGAHATLPESLSIFSKWNSSSGETFNYSSVPTQSFTYDIKLKGDKKTTKVTLKGKPIIDLLKLNGVDVATTPFVKAIVTPSKSTGSAGRMALIPLATDKPETPAMILESGSVPGRGPWRTPSIVPPQVSSDGISENQISYFNGKKEALSLKPAKQGAQIMGVKIEKKPTGKGEYRIEANVVSNKPSGALKYQWFSTDSNGNYIEVEDHRVWVTKDAKTGVGSHVVNVVVTSESTGSTGIQSDAYQSRRSATDGKKGDPFKPTGSTPATGTVPGTTGGDVGGNGTGLQPTPGAVTAPSPGTQTTTPPPTTTQPTPPTTQPTPETGETVTAADTSGITNVAQNISGAGPLTTVTGVLLSAPTVAAAGGGGGSPITELPAPVATELNTIFQPVEEPGDLWPYLLSVLFALCFTGAVREWVNP